MTEQELKELEKFAKENGYDDELKDIYLREVIDQNKEFDSLCNKSMVDLERIERSTEDADLGDVKSDLMEHDAQRLRSLIQAHFDKTGSERAKQIIELWDQYLPMFVKVFPVDYRRALMDLKRVQSEQSVTSENMMAGE